MVLKTKVKQAYDDDLAINRATVRPAERTDY